MEKTLTLEWVRSNFLRCCFVKDSEEHVGMNRNVFGVSLGVVRSEKIERGFLDTRNELGTSH